MENIEIGGECCICLSKSNLFSLLKLYNFKDNVEIYSTMIAECFQIELSSYIEECYRNLYLICEDCVLRLRDAILLRSQIQIAYDRLREYRKEIIKAKEHEISDYDNNMECDMDVAAKASLSNFEFQTKTTSSAPCCVFKCKGVSDKITKFTKENLQQCLDVLRVRIAFDMKYNDIVFPDCADDVYGYHSICWNYFMAIPKKYFKKYDKLQNQSATSISSGRVSAKCNMNNDTEVISSEYLDVVEMKEHELKYDVLEYNNTECNKNVVSAASLSKLKLPTETASSDLCCVLNCKNVSGNIIKFTEESLRRFHHTLRIRAAFKMKYSDVVLPDCVDDVHGYHSICGGYFRAMPKIYAKRYEELQNQSTTSRGSAECNMKSEPVDISSEYLDVVEMKEHELKYDVLEYDNTKCNMNVASRTSSNFKPPTLTLTNPSGCCVFKCKRPSSGVIKKFTEETLQKCRDKLCIRVAFNMKYNNTVLPDRVDDVHGYHTTCRKNFLAISKPYIEKYHKLQNQSTTSISSDRVSDCSDAELLTQSTEASYMTIDAEEE